MEKRKSFFIRFHPEFWWRNWSNGRKRKSLLMLHFLLILLYGCGTIVYKDKFDSAILGEPPPPPEIGTSIVSGNVVIAQNPINDVSSDLWLQLKRQDPVGTLSKYEAKLKETVTKTGSIAFVSYVPAYSPITMSVYFFPPDFGPAIELLHIDLMADGKIRVNDDSIKGTYKFDTSVVFLVSFKLNVSPPTATLLIRGGDEDANATVEIPPAAAGFGLGRIRIETPFEGINSPPGRFFINEVIATRGSE